LEWFCGKDIQPFDDDVGSLQCLGWIRRCDSGTPHTSPLGCLDACDCVLYDDATFQWHLVE